MTAEHVDNSNVFLIDFGCPAAEIFTFMELQSINQKTRKEEVIGHIPLLGDFLMDFFSIACMDFGEKLKVIPVCDVANLF